MPIRLTRIVLGCSGDLTTSVAIPWLTQRHGAEIVTVTLDLGQGGALADVRERALAAGAVRAHVIDVRDEFARDFILPALQVGALDREGDGVEIRLVRLLVARHLVAAAALEDAAAVAHGMDDAGASDSFVEAVRSLNPRLRVLAPAREWRLTRAEQIDYARARDIPVLETAQGPSASSQRTRAAADSAASVTIQFVCGLPVAINGVDLPLVDLIDSLTTIGGAHGVGHRNPSGPPSDGPTLEAPAAAILRAGCRDLRTAGLPAKVLRTLPDLAANYADLIARGQWFTASRETLHARLTTAQEFLTGTVRLELFKGSCRVVDVDVPGPEMESISTASEFQHEVAGSRTVAAQV